MANNDEDLTNSENNSNRENRFQATLDLFYSPYKFVAWSAGLLLVILASMMVFGGGELFAMFGTGSGRTAVLEEELSRSRHELQALQEERDALALEVDRVRLENEALQNEGLYIVVSTTSNRVYLMDGNVILRECVAATGRNQVIWRFGQRFYFHTPVGRREVLEKVEDPVWIRPNWYWLERGDTVPENITVEDRKMRGQLGDYALRLGDGYMIHGTNAPSSLGRSVTHGCIRLGAEDLRAVFNAAEIGTPVYIY